MPAYQVKKGYAVLIPPVNRTRHYTEGQVFEVDEAEEAELLKSQGWKVEKVEVEVIKPTPEPSVEKTPMEEVLAQKAMEADAIMNRKVNGKDAKKK